MAIREIMLIPHPCLRKVAAKVEKVDSKIQNLVDDMMETMNHADGVGLAAVQINVNLRIFVMNAQEDGSNPIVAINPQILSTSADSVTRREGCLSIPGFYEDVSRPGQVKFSALDRQGEPYEAEVEGLEAACVQHEIDHLDGKLFLDYISGLKRDRIRKKMEKQARER